MHEFLGGMGISGGLLSSIMIYAVVIGGMYFLLFRPQQKRKKQEEEMRKSIQIGDEITTIGGIVGRVVSVKSESDSLVIESGSDKIRVRKWAVATVENANTKEQQKQQ
jgi:preprotein translocase subunit YajC